MPNVTSPLGTSQRYIPLVNSSEIGKAAGLHMHFATLANLLLAVGTVAPLAGERGNITSSQATWQAGQPFSVATEPAGVHRVWVIGASAALSHARTVVLPSGATVVLAGDTNTVFATTGVPGVGVGADGDLAVDVAGNARYIKGASAWGGATAIFPGSSAGAGSVGLSAVTYNGDLTVSGYTLGGVVYTFTYPNATTIRRNGSDGSLVTITLNAAGDIVSVV
jgi:hypothetical protein